MWTLRSPRSHVKSSLAQSAKGPFSLVAANSVYGTGEIETLLRKAGKGCVLSVASNHVFRSSGKQQLVAGSLPRSRKTFSRRPGAACRPAEGPKVRPSTSRPISNWPISKSVNTTTSLRGNGRGGLLVRRQYHRRAAWPSSPHDAPRVRSYRIWCR